MSRWLCLLALTIACSGDDPDDTPEPEPVDCGSDADVYTPGLSAPAGDYEVVFDAADPSPPDRGDNVWTVQVLDASGAPVQGLQMEVEPFMPEHGHGTSPATFPATAEGDAYTFGPVDLFMPGLWVVTFHVDDGAAASAAEFRFCLEG
jgi:hypothetical protein